MSDSIPKLGATLGYLLILPVVLATYIHRELTHRTDYPAWMDRAADRLEEAGVL